MHHQRQLSHPPVSAPQCRPPPQPLSNNNNNQQQQPPVGATNGDISRVYIGGLDRRATHGDLAVFCQQVGQVRGCRVAYDHATNASKCYGYADYATPLDALRAVAYLNGALLFQRPCRVTPVLRDTSSRKGAVRESVAGLTESPAQLAALDRAARDEKLRAAVAWRIMAHHRDHADSLSRAFVAALGHEPASLLALLAYPTLLEAWVWEALGVSGPSQPTSPHQQQHPAQGVSARGKNITPAPSAPCATDAHPLTPPLAPTAGATEDSEALELRLDAMVRTFSEDDGPNARDGTGSNSSGTAQRNSTSPDSCGSGGGPAGVEAPLCAAVDAPVDGAPATEAALRGALQQYPFLIRVAGQGRPQLPPPPIWRGGPLTASAASAALSLSGHHHHAFATPVMSPATMSPYVSATSTPSGLAATTGGGAPSAAAVSTGSGPMLPPGGGAAHVSPLLFGAMPPHTYHGHQQHQHQHQHQRHQQHGPMMMPPSPMNLTGFAQHNNQHQQSGGGHAGGSPTQQQQQQQQQRPFVVAGGPQFPAATPHDVASIFGAPLRGVHAPGSAERALVPGAGVWSPTAAASAAAAVAAMAAFASAGGVDVGSPTFGGHLPPPPPPSLPSAMFGFFNAPVHHHPGCGVVAGPFNVVLGGQPALHGDPTRSLPVMLPGLASANAVPPSFPPPGLHRQQRLARQQHQQQQRQIAALVAVAAGGGAIGDAAASVNHAAGPPGLATSNMQPQRHRRGGGGGSGGAPGGHFRCLSDQVGNNGALLPDLANSSPQECGVGHHEGLRRLCATSTDSGAALDLLLLQAAASEVNGSASTTAVNTLSSCGSVGTAAAHPGPPLLSTAGSAAASLQW